MPSRRSNANEDAVEPSVSAASTRLGRFRRRARTVTLATAVLASTVSLAGPSRVAVAGDLKTAGPESTVKSGGGDLDVGKPATTVPLTPGGGPSPSASEAGRPASASSSAAPSSASASSGASTAGAASGSERGHPTTHGAGAGGVAPAASDSAGAAPAEGDDDGASAAATAPSVIAHPRRPLVHTTIALGLGDLGAGLTIPDDWPALGEGSLPSVDVAGQDGVSVLSRAGYGAFEPKRKPPEVRELVVACAKAPGDRWADAVRDAAFVQLISGVEKEAQKYSSLGSIEPEPMRTVGNRYEQSFHADAEVESGGARVRAVGQRAGKGGASLSIVGRSIVGFGRATDADKGAPSIVACSITCAEVVPTGASSVCPDVMASLELTGNWAAPPSKSWWVEWALRLRNNPTLAWSVGGGAFVGLVAIVAIPVVWVARRRRRARGAADVDRGEHERDGDFDDERDESDDDEPASADGSSAAPTAAGQSAEAIAAKLMASPPPPAGYYDPSTLQRRRG
jgi:hypothetical protein